MCLRWPLCLQERAILRDGHEEIILRDGNEAIIPRNRVPDRIDLSQQTAALAGNRHLQRCLCHISPPTRTGIRLTQGQWPALLHRGGGGVDVRAGVRRGSVELQS